MPRAGRPPRYDWEDKRDICHKLYVEEKKSIGQIIKYFANHFGVDEEDLPSEKNFARQFSLKWKFPPRKRVWAIELEEELGKRMKELWEQNMHIVEIREALEREGHPMSNYDFAKLKRKYGVKRRGDVAFGSLSTEKPTQASKTADVSQQTPPGATDPFIEEDSSVLPVLDSSTFTEQPATEDRTELSPEEAALRAQRVTDFQTYRLELRQARKRRRRERGLQDLPRNMSDTTGHRYVCEITLDECKSFLNLDNDLYLAVRKQFEDVCVEMDIERKSKSLEGGRWQESKDRLVRENMHLSAVMHPLQPGMDEKALGLDLICADVTKRMRDNKKHITIAEANNIIGINPADSKALRRAFYEILKADHYISRLACGDEHWQELRQNWFDGSPFLQQVLAEEDPRKARCVDLLCRDASKRYNDDMLKQNPDRRQFQRTSYGPGPGAVTHKIRKRRSAKQDSAPLAHANNNNNNGNGNDKGNSQIAPMNQPSFNAPLQMNEPQLAPLSNFSTVTQMSHFNGHIDPALATVDLYAPTPQNLALHGPFSSNFTARGPIPAYFRLSPASQIIGHHARMWLGKLSSATIPALHAAATIKAGGARVKKVQGIVKNDDGSEDNYQIDGDDELAVYLEAAGEKPTFLVTLEAGYA